MNFERSKRKPVVGLALGSGVARGWCHIGVLKELDAQGVKPDVIAGASIGALIGGSYAVGKLDEIEAFACSLTPRSFFGLLDFSWRGSGLLGGKGLKSLVEAQFKAQKIEECSRPFAAVATDLVTGHEVWLTRGNLAEAILASTAIPGVLEPVLFKERLLVDGALVNPMPITVCRALGADLVIAISIICDCLGRGAVVSDAITPSLVHDADNSPAASSAKMQKGFWVPRVAGVLIDAFNITQDRIARIRMAGDPPELTIKCRTNGIGLFDFHRAEELIQIGQLATRAIIPEIIEEIAILEHAIRLPEGA